ncbi:XRE family transcriptional regulator [Actinocrispum wychmicini]|uniref:Tetratricopeptide (TPR) repeat protein n=1 Tax=Actinocrispum wychmicini TaxID=1213861 RepID=A0A4R2J929_9PSEU|nr:XRE family transcriptional regulator [Actinocrispum wychmicini]TCO55821.1 tetratricopeptide (TPR) repeat protein [Actinocrispum wychmicini]
MSAFGTELRSLRERAGMSLTTLAKLVPTSKGYLSRIENGKVNASRGIAAACDRALDAKGRLCALATRSAGPGRPPGPVGLPAGTRHFVGRETELARLSAMLLHQDAVRVCVVHGMAGVGKTAVAISAARAVIDDFPDGCLFFDLRGHTPGAPVLTAEEGLRRVLGLVDVPGEKIPPDVEGQANLLQTLLRGRRVLFVFDNVRTADQVRLLLPAEPGCRVIITSRGRLAALDDAWPVPLDVLPQAEAVALFRSVAGPSVAADDKAVRDIVACCGLLPLAIRIAAARLVAGGWTTAGLLGRLTSQDTRLSSLNDGERSVEAVFKVSYDALPAEQRWLFGLLALHPATAAEITAVHALAGLAPDETDRLLDRLHDAHLVTRNQAGFIEVHDLTRMFAVRYALPEVSRTDQTAAAGRLVDYALALVNAADELVEPQRFRPEVTTEEHGLPFEDTGTALAWLRRHWPALVQVVDLAARFGHHRHCWQLTLVLRSYFFRERLLDPWISTHELALTSARQAGDVSGAAMILNNLGMARLEQGDLAEAITCHNRAKEYFDRAGNGRGTTAVSSRAWALAAEGDLVAAHRDLTSTLAVYRRTARTRNTAIALRGLAFVLAAMGQFDEALAHAHEAHGLLKLPRDALMTINCIAWIHFRAGRLDEAEHQYQSAVTLAELDGSEYELARALTGVGNVAARRGEPEVARRRWEEADEYCVQFNPRLLGEAQARAELA